MLGHHKGDPLSPYLFIICVEAFSVMLQRAQAEGSIEVVRICEGALTINHLFFTDDSLIFMRANVQSAKKLQEILALYEAQSGR
jgi:hypothetical protein